MHAILRRYDHVGEIRFGSTCSRRVGDAGGRNSAFEERHPFMGLAWDWQQGCVGEAARGSARSGQSMSLKEQIDCGHRARARPHCGDAQRARTFRQAR